MNRQMTNSSKAGSRLPAQEFAKPLCKTPQAYLSLPAWASALPAGGSLPYVLLLAVCCVQTHAQGLAELLDTEPLIEPLVTAAIERGDMPGCVVCLGRGSGIALLEAYGNRAVQPQVEKMTTDTVFDLASLTKPISTATAVMQLLERGQLRLQDEVADHLPDFAAAGKQDVTIEQLLTHTAGLIPDNPVEDYRHGKQEAWKRIDALKPVVPPGTEFKYTDVGFLTLGRIVEKLTGKPLNVVVNEQTFGPLEMNDTGYLPGESLRKRAAPTTQQYVPEKSDRWLRGEVHDPRAALLGGVAGHAALFGTAKDLSRYARMMLGEGKLKGVRVLGAATVREMIRPRETKGQRRGLGWDIRTGYSRNRGETMSPRAFGHGGFTGTGIWIDPELDLFVIFLSSRLHPDDEGTVNDLIGRIGTIAASALPVRSSAR